MAVAVMSLSAVSLTVRDLARSVRFFEEGLGFVVEGEERRAGEKFERLMGIEGAAARVALLRLGEERVELLAFDRPGRDYPADSRSPDLWFQHFATITTDIKTAYARVMAAGATAISTHGPQTLPASSGGVTAFKFRDPDGHPLELLQFQTGQAPDKWRADGSERLAGPNLGIDHSAVAVADTGRSEAFYVGLLGLHVGSRSLNRGLEQERLDATFNAVVEVTGLEVGDREGPHVELLCYRVPPTGRPIPRTAATNDIAATRLVFEAGDVRAIADEAVESRRELVSPGVVTFPDGTEALAMRDPDGHLLVFRSR